MLQAVGKVDGDPDREPDSQLYPGGHAQKAHLRHAGDSAKRRHHGNKGDFERALHLGMAVAEDQYSDADDRKEKQRRQ